jgi:LacI family transcriptional regulator
VSVVGFDDVFGADFCHPPLTTLGERTAEAGARAIALLTQQVTAGTRDTPARVLPTQLVVRASSGPAPDGSTAAAAP